MQIKLQKIQKDTGSYKLNTSVHFFLNPAVDGNITSSLAPTIAYNIIHLVNMTIETAQVVYVVGSSGTGKVRTCRY